MRASPGHHHSFEEAVSLLVEVPVATAASGVRRREAVMKQEMGREEARIDEVEYQREGMDVARKVLGREGMAFMVRAARKGNGARDRSARRFPGTKGFLGIEIFQE